MIQRWYGSHGFKNLNTHGLGVCRTVWSTDHMAVKVLKKLKIQSIKNMKVLEEEGIIVTGALEMQRLNHVLML